MSVHSAGHQGVGCVVAGALRCCGRRVVIHVVCDVASQPMNHRSRPAHVLGIALVAAGVLTIKSC